MKREYWGRGEIIHTHEQFNTRLIFLYFTLFYRVDHLFTRNLVSCNRFWSRNKCLSNSLPSKFLHTFCMCQIQIKRYIWKVKKQNQKKLKDVAGDDPGDNSHHNGYDERIDGLYYSRRHKQSNLLEMIVLIYRSPVTKSSLANLD